MSFENMSFGIMLHLGLRCLGLYRSGLCHIQDFVASGLMSFVIMSFEIMSFKIMSFEIMSFWLMSFRFMSFVRHNVSVLLVCFLSLISIILVTIL